MALHHPRTNLQASGIRLREDESARVSKGAGAGNDRGCRWLKARCFDPRVAGEFRGLAGIVSEPALRREGQRNPRVSFGRGPLPPIAARPSVAA